MSFIKSLKSLSEQDRRILEAEFKRLNDEIVYLKNKPTILSETIKKQIEDIARRQAHYHGSSTYGALKVKDKIRIDRDDIRKTTSAIISGSGELILEGELIIG